MKNEKKWTRNSWIPEEHTNDGFDLIDFLLMLVVSGVAVGVAWVMVVLVFCI